MTRAMGVVGATDHGAFATEEAAEDASVLSNEEVSSGRRTPVDEGEVDSEEDEHEEVVDRERRVEMQEEDLEELISDPMDAATEYFKTAPEKWSLINFLEKSKKKVGDDMFFSEDFWTWYQRFSNRVIRMIRESTEDHDYAGKQHAYEVLKASKCQKQKNAANAWFESNRSTYRNMCSVKPLIGFFADSMEALVEDDRRRIKTSRKRKARLPPTPSTPDHEYWVDVFYKARMQDLPHNRLSLPRALRSRMRLRIVENAHCMLQALVRRNSGMRASNRDFGQLAEDAACEIMTYTLAFPERVDRRLLHFLAQGRPMRNSPVHVRDRSNESAPWDSDFVFVTRAAPFAALVTALRNTDDKWSRIEEDRVVSIRRDLHDAIVLAAITARKRVEGHLIYANTQREVERPSTAEDELDALGVVKGPFVAGILLRLADVAVKELKKVLQNEFALVPAGRDLSDLTGQLAKQPVTKAKAKLRLYGGSSAATLRRSILFAADEAKSFATSTDTVPVALALYYVGAFIEFLVTLKMKTKDLRPYLAEWEALVVACAEGSGLDEIEQAKLTSDEKYRKRLKRTDLSSDDYSEALPDPFVTEGGRESSTAQAGTKYDAHIKTESDPELEKLEQEIAKLEKKKALLSRLAKLKAEVGEK